jgi:uncharacterized protein involved in outer membrane biogenesis
MVTLFLIVGTAVFLFWKYQEKIISLVIQELSKELNTEVKVGKVDLSLNKFPDLSVHFSKVLVKGTLADDDTLLIADNLYCAFRFWDVFNQNYHIRQVFLEDGRLNIKRINQGNNYQVFRTSTEKSDVSISFDIEKLVIKNFEIFYSDIDRNQYFTYYTGSSMARLGLKGDLLDIDLKGGFVSNLMQVNERLFVRDMPFNLSSKMTYHIKEQHMQFHDAMLQAHNSGFSITGHVGDEDYQFSITGKDTDIQALMAFLPEGFDKEIKAYQSKGDIYFSADIKGLVKDDMPLIQVQFGSRNAQFYHPKYRESVRNVSLEGSYTNGNERNYKTSVLKLRNIRGKLNGKDFKGNLELSNFDNYYLSFDLLADIDANSFLKFFPVAQIYRASGEIWVDVQFKGHINDMQNINRLNRVKSTGEINFKKLDFRLKDIALSFDAFRGNLIFQDDAVAISNFSGKISNSDFLINGFVRNGLAYLLFENAPLKVEADLVSEKIMINELLSGNTSTAEGNYESYSFRISPRLDIDFNCKIGYLEFRRFQAKDIRGQLLVKDRVASSKEISFSTLGGRMMMNGSVNAKRENHIDVFTITRLDRIDIDQLFYVFEDFNQNFLTNQHLKGQIFADLRTYMLFNNKLQLATDKLISDISISIKNGELNNFEPMKKLSRYVDERSLERLRFSELRNQILVQNRNIHLPQMEVVSNVTKLKVSGTHTFDQHINYQVMTPLKRLNRGDRDERFGYVRDDGKGNLNLFLRIQGTTEDYRVTYDGEAWKENLKENIRTEVQEVKDVFRTKGQTERNQVESKELNTEEYFDF